MKNLLTIPFLTITILASMTSCTEVKEVNPEADEPTEQAKPSSEEPKEDEGNEEEKKEGDNQSENFGTILNAVTPTGYEAKMDQQYGSNKFQKYDVYVPILNSEDSEEKSVSVVLVHGGGWSLLDKSFLSEVVEEFKKQKLNVTIFNINHRLAGIDGTTFPDIMQDFDLFFAHHQGLKASLNLRDEVVMWGYSSGGHLCLTYSYKNPDKNIRAVAAVAAPTDLTRKTIHDEIIDDKNRNLTELLIGQDFDSNPQAYRNASPIYAVNSNCPQTILFYGAQDDLVEKEQGSSLHSRLQSNGVLSEYNVLPGATHQMKGQMNKIVNMTAVFLEKL